MTDPTTIPFREMTKSQRGKFANFSKRVFNKALHALGPEAEEMMRTESFASTFPDQEVQAQATMKLGEVVYTIIVCARREEESV
jgi:hypothetical protein